MTKLHIQDVQHMYLTTKSATTALEHINLSIEEGEFVSFLGPSGCGKTTLLSIIAGLIEPSSGSVTIDGENIGTSVPNIGYMLQQDYLFPWKTIKENILLGLEIRGQLTDETEKKALLLLKEIGLQGVDSLYPHQ
jgi:NitT/TauT family transport system ATP-binding protein